MSKEQIKVENGYIMYEEEKEEITQDDLENKNLFKFNESASILLEEAYIRCFSNGYTDLYDYTDLGKFLPEEEKVNQRNIRQRLIQNVLPKFIYSDVLVSYRNDITKMNLVSEDGLYHIILNTKHPRTEQLKMKLLASIRRFKCQSGWSVAKFLTNSEIGVDSWLHEFDDSGLRKLLQEIIYDTTDKINKKNLAIFSINTFPVLHDHIVTNEYTSDYINSIDKVKLYNKVDYKIGCKETVYNLAKILGLSDETILDNLVRCNIRPINIFKDIYYDPIDIYQFLQTRDEIKDPRESMLILLTSLTNSKMLGLILLESIDKFIDVDYAVSMEVYNYYAKRIELIMKDKLVNNVEAVKIAKTKTIAHFKYYNKIDF